VKRKRKGLTIIEILTVVAIIAILVGLLLPATSMVRRLARETKQKAQFTAVGLGLEAFKNDFGTYPASNRSPNTGTPSYGGTQKLSEALLGRDLLGYHPQADLSAPDFTATAPYYDPNVSNIEVRKDLYIDIDTANPYRLGYVDISKPGLFNTTNMTVTPDSFALCDVFGRWPIKLTDRSRQVKVGTPVLYFRANPVMKLIPDGQTVVTGNDFSQFTYNYWDNEDIVLLMANQFPTLEIHNETFGGGGATWFYRQIRDTRISAVPTAMRRDSYILISAGHDGIYGTADDIYNFERN
jgi:prepilin-type N-terminal cleavage/methylation domain-containing protein